MLSVSGSSSAPAETLLSACPWSHVARGPPLALTPLTSCHGPGPLGEGLTRGVCGGRQHSTALGLTCVRADVETTCTSRWTVVLGAPRPQQGRPPRRPTAPGHRLPTRRTRCADRALGLPGSAGECEEEQGLSVFSAADCQRPVACGASPDLRRLSPHLLSEHSASTQAALLSSGCFL